jgi:hypothetical protein
MSITCSGRTEGQSYGQFPTFSKKCAQCVIHASKYHLAAPFLRRAALHGRGRWNSLKTTGTQKNTISHAREPT